MAKERNQPIGTCPCPVKGCDETVPVYRYRQRAELEGRRRHAGKLYVTCPTHGRAEPQEWILEHATIRGEAEPPAPKPQPRPAPAKSPEAKRASSSSSGGGFGFFR